MSKPCSIKINTSKNIESGVLFDSNQTNFTYHSCFNIEDNELKGSICKIITKITLIINSVSMSCTMNVHV